jgi:hypothetical protein
MDITRVLALVRPFFDERGEPYAIVGGLALLAYGAARATFDVDLLAPRGTRDDFVAYLEARGFATLSVQAGFSNHQNPDVALGRLDVIYVSGTTAEAVFAGCAARTLAPGVEVPVPRPEHLVAMKVQAFAGDRTRYSDLTDLQFLLSLPELDHAGARLLRSRRALGLLRAAPPAMTIDPFDLGLTEEDLRALREARSRRLETDRQVALKLIAEWGPLVDATVRRRPLFRGAPFTLAGHEEDPGS